MNPKVYIIILNYQTWRDTVECLESLFKLEYDNYQIIVVDNESPNKSIDCLVKWAYGEIPFECKKDNVLKHFSYPNVSKPINFSIYSNEEVESKKINFIDTNRIIFIQSNKNKGYAAGNNIGIKYALFRDDFEYVWILNNDIVVEKDSLHQLVLNRSKSNTKFWICGTMVKFYYSPDIIQSLGGKYNKYLGFSKQISSFKKLSKIKNVTRTYVSGCSVFLNKLFLDKVGLMSEDYFLYFEEMDLLERASKLGFISEYCYESIVYHKDGASTKIDKKSSFSSPFSDYHFTKSKLIFTKKYYRKYLISIYFSFLIVLINRLRKRRLRNINYILKALFE